MTDVGDWMLKIWVCIVESEYSIDDIEEVVMSSFYINGDIGDGTDTAIFC
jgi:hypothetical protein